MLLFMHLLSECLNFLQLTLIFHKFTESLFLTTLLNFLNFPKIPIFHPNPQIFSLIPIVQPKYHINFTFRALFFHNLN